MCSLTTAVRFEEMQTHQMLFEFMFV